MVFWSDPLADTISGDIQAALAGGMLDRLAEYGVGPGEFVATHYADVSFPAPYDDLALLQELGKEMDSGLVETPLAGGQDIYVLFLPPAGTSVILTAEHASGYHAATTHNATPYYYAMVQSGPRLQEDVVASHEIYEAATDPDAASWRNWPSLEELADMCEGDLEIIGGVTVEQVWSQVKLACE